MGDKKDLEAEGTIHPEDLEQTYEVPDARPKVEKKADSSVSKVAEEVRMGKWGIGQERRKALADAGYNVKEVEAEVIRQSNP